MNYELLQNEVFFGKLVRLYFPDSPAYFTDLLNNKIHEYLTSGVPKPLPYFEEEVTPSLESIFKPFSKVFLLPSLQQEQALSTLLSQTHFHSLLILAGQRQTPASLTDIKGIPPTKERLIHSFCKEYKQSLSIGARAWAKHAERSEDQFWGAVKGSTATKNQVALKLLDKILVEHTWWNTFGHYVHDTVFEMRLPSGHGMRWGQNGKVFIGFLEPFINQSS